MTVPPSSGALAIITGASSGIGAEFARQLAASGNDLLLVARRTDRLTALANALNRQHSVSCHVLTLDLGENDAAERIRDAALATGRPVKWLVNNAGYGLIRRLSDHSVDDVRRFVQVLGTAPVETTLLLLPALRRSAPSYIVNVASLAGWMPGIPGAGLYPGIKAFLLRFSQTLAIEERRNGVRVTASCPGFTDTEIFDADGGGQAVMGNAKPMPVAVVVSEAIAAAERGDVSMIHGRSNRIVAWLMRHLPVELARTLAARNDPDKNNNNAI